MKKLIVIIAVLFFAINVFAQHEQFIPIEQNDLQKFFSVHTEEEGPGTDYFDSLLLRLHVKKRIEPLFITKYDSKILESVLKKTQSRFSVLDFKYKYYFEFPSNAEWKEDKAVLSLFINDSLSKSYNNEIQKNDEFWIFFIITEYNTFTMEGYGRVVDFLSKEAMIKKGLLVTPL